jgi:hypothetical protein
LSATTPQQQGGAVPPLVPVVFPMQVWHAIIAVMRTRSMEQVEDIVAALRIQTRDRCAEARIDYATGNLLPPLPPPELRNEPEPERAPAAPPAASPPTPTHP